MVKKNRKIIVVISWFLVFLWMGVIFYFSSQPAVESQEMSKRISEPAMQTIERVSPDGSINFNLRELNNFIRKSAHFFLYLILGMLTLNALRKSSLFGVRGIMITFLICILYAIFDEIYQEFVPGRSGKVFDVVIDGIGSMTGIFLYLKGIKIKKFFTENKS